MPRIHVTGGSGSGTTTLGRALAERLGVAHLDADDYYWLPTVPPYREKRPPIERRRLLLRDLLAHAGWTLSGSLVSWGGLAVPHFDLVVHLSCPTPVRLARLEVRERDAGIPAEDTAQFLAWSAGYDHGGLEMRSRLVHDRWLEALPCPVLRLDGSRPVADGVAAVVARL